MNNAEPHADIVNTPVWEKFPLGMANIIIGHLQYLVFNLLRNLLDFCEKNKACKRLKQNVNLVATTAARVANRVSIAEVCNALFLFTTAANIQQYEALVNSSRAKLFNLYR